MMGNMVAAAVLALFAQAERPALEPTTDWNVQYNENSCLAQRTFGAGDDAITLGIRPTPKGAAGLMLFGRRALPAGTGPIQVTLADGDKTVSTPGANRKVKAGAQLIQTSLFDNVRDLIRGSDTLTLTMKGRPPVRLRPGYGSALQKALDACETDLLQSWGIDAAVLARSELETAVAMKSDPASWPRSSDYPVGAIIDDEEAVLSLLMVVDPATGRVTDCKGTMVVGMNGWDKIACNLVKQRARYSKAPSLDGPIIKSLRLRFKLHDSP